MKFIFLFVQRILDYLERSVSDSQLRYVQHVGHSTRLGRGVKVEHPECISLGSDIYINDYCWFSVLVENRETGRPLVNLFPNLTIGDRTYIGRFGTISCINRILIGNDVMISDRVFIGDGNHGYARTDLPIKDQYMMSNGGVEIGDGTWIGIGVSVLSNVKIGRNCVIAAGSVVVSDIPDFCVAAGAPAIVVKKINDN